MSTSSNILLQLSYMSCSTMYDFSFQVAKSGEDFTSNGSPFAKTLLSCLFMLQISLTGWQITSGPTGSHPQAKPGFSLGFLESLMLGQRPEKIRG